MDVAIVHLSEQTGAIKIAFSRALYNLYFFCKPFLDSSRNRSLH